MCICNDFPCVVSLVVDNIFYGGSLLCPLTVADDIWGHHCTEMVVRPGQPVML